MSSEDNFAINSSSSSDTSNINSWNESFNEFAQWHERNMELDNMVEDVITSNPNEFFQPPNPSRRARRQYIERNREDGHKRLLNDYFVDDPVYCDRIFRRRFRMQKHVFLRIVDALQSTDQYFHQMPNGNGRLGFSALQKCTAAIRVLAYGSSADAIDEYMGMSETVVKNSLVHFVEGVISVFGGEYLRRPNEQDMARLLSVGEQRGFPGMMDSIDCMHWEWKNWPSEWAGQYAGRNKKTTMILEAVASYDLWIWHAFFGTPGSSNDINVFQRSPVFNDILEGRAPAVNYSINGNEYNMGYYLTDGIYPPWAAFVKSITAPQLQKHKLFAQCQESVRKDVKRAFGVLQARFAFIKRPCQFLDKGLVGKIMMACIIMHNMIVEDERDTYQNHYDITEFNEDLSARNRAGEADDEPLRFRTEVSCLAEYMKKRSQIRGRETHNAIQRDLIEHINQKFGNHN